LTGFLQTIMKRLVRQLIPVVVLVSGVFVGGLALAQGAPAAGVSLSSFNHDTTGFIIRGAHLRERCESCHVQAIFRGTPGDCATCHRPGGLSPGKPPSHIQTSSKCDSCHNQFVWSPSSFRHQPDQGVMQGECLKCHNGFSAPGKPLVHPVTSASCDSCHKTAAWFPAGYSHALATPGACATCHNGSRATGKSATHIPTTASCDACHSAGVPFISVVVATMHSNMAGPMSAGSCSTCHSGAFTSQNAQSKPATHVPTSAQCDTCHKSTTSWATGVFDHGTASSPVVGRCSDCHNGINALGKPGSHIPSLQQCDSCHTNFTSFKPATMDHARTGGQCATCHNGSYKFANAQATPAAHIRTTLQCDTCHLSGFKFWAPATMNHAGQAGKCITCHSGGFISQNAQTKPATHIATTAQCDTCHSSTTTWATGTLNHATVTPAAAGRCSACHNGTSALSKPVTHIPTTAQCDTCHKNYTAFAPAAMDHANTAGPVAAANCVRCHNGSYGFANAQPRTISHIPASTLCDNCHTTTAWIPATMNHSGLAGLCSACHSGTYVSLNAQVKPATHVSTAAQCDTCHRSTTSWATVTYSHGPTATGQCDTCHGSTALSKPAGIGHIPTSAQCDTCHKNYTAFTPAIMDHTNTYGPLAAGNCIMCHSGSYRFANAQAKTATHVPTTQSCDTCHASTSAWKPVTYAHSATAPGNCSTCHTGSTALGKPATHIPTTGQCDLCHGNFIAFKPASMNHAGTVAQCSSCHSGTYTAINAQAKPAATHITTSGQCDTCHTNYIAFKPASMNHTGVAGQCSTCHDGIKALGKPPALTGHIPTAAQCDTCHVNGFISFRPGTMNHAGTAGNCSTCHSGTYTAFNAQIKTTNHIATTAQCDSSGCHTSTTTWANTTLNHAVVTPAVNNRCSACHNGINALGVPTTHIPTGGTGGVQCDTCHKTFVAFAPASMRHSGLPAPVLCDSCHGGGYVSVNAQAKPGNHISDPRQCSTCHASTTAWKPASYSHPAGALACNGCHNGATALGKPAGAAHISTSAQCSTCHLNYVAFKPATMNHTGTTGQCSACHTGTYLSFNAQVKPPTHIPTSAQCDSSNCHTSSTTSWAIKNWAHDASAIGNCSSCHNGLTALSKPTTHIPTSAQCDTCHKNFASFRPAAMSHPATTGPVATGNCATCHGGSYTAVNALTKSTAHIPTTGQCDTCHSGYAAWSPTTMNHAGQTSCTTCHSGAYVTQNAQKKSAAHIVTTAQCSTCHSSTTTWATGVFNHATASPPVAGICATCHNGTNAIGKPASSHIRTSAQCDTCHKNFTAFAPALMSHTGTTGPVAAANCSTCHNGSYTAVNAQAKTATHIVTSAQCDTCHNSTTTWVGASFAHAATAVGTCSTCHNGVNALGKPAGIGHIPTAFQCDTCHTNYVTFKPARMNHAGTAAQCTTCHSGSYTAINALSKLGTHIPTGAQCDTCHTNGFIAFAPATMSHAGTNSPVAAGNCSTCHGGTYTAVNAQAKTGTHIATTAQCDSCHVSTTTWATATFNHATASPAVAGRCSPACHNGTNALGKPTTHIPTAAQCDTCHKTFVAFAPAAMRHTGTGATVGTHGCATCHGGTYVSVNALAKPSNHIVTTDFCDNCHNNTTAWKPVTVDHSTIVPTVVKRCSSCHNGTNALGKPLTHIPTGAQCDSCHAVATAFAPTRMNHTGAGVVVTNTCSTCHSGTYLSINAQVKTATHVPTTKQCDTCHTSTSTWATATFTHAVTDVNCSTCHNGATALGKPTTHIPTGAQCSACHKNYISFRPAAMSHPATTGPVATGNCSTCHNGSYVAVNALTKLATHIPVTGQCDSCHTGYVAWAPSNMNHTGQTSCTTCHGGAYVAQNAQKKTLTHIATTAQCSTCHNSTTTWATGTFNHATASPPATGICSTCHNGTNALGKPASIHIRTTAQCDVCHKNFTAFAPAIMSHTGTTGPVAAGNCITCHNGSYTAVNAKAKTAAHILTSQSCDVCHMTTAWKPTSFAHTGITAGPCTTCHNGIAAVAKPAVHIPTSASCEACHRIGMSWLPLITPYSHAGIGVGTCATCHVASYPNIEAKSASHLPTTASCDACHNTTAWLPVKHPYSHSGVVPNQCATCHGGTYTGIMVRPSNHIPTTLAGLLGTECSNCHSPTQFTSFGTGQKMKHGSINASCATCHASSATYLGSMQKINRASHHSAGSKDCSVSGCHKPLGKYGTPYTKWN
jgi:predicted CXXCH cytochrome family protein